MTIREHSRRAGILCNHCLRNIAFYRSWYKVGKPFNNNQFWVTANGNFLDIAILEWCKLFADTKGKHYLTKVVVNSDLFMKDMLNSIELTPKEFTEYVESMKIYRDKFVAHLDDHRTMKIPKLTVAKKSTKLLYKCLLAQESGTDTFNGAPRSISKLYKKFLTQGKKAYKS